MNIYAGDRRLWSEDDLDVLRVFADMATAFLVRNAELAESRDLARQLEGALDSRVLIEQAKGVIANQYDISVDAAFERLRRHSQDHNIKLTDVCMAVVEHGLKIPERERTPTGRLTSPDITVVGVACRRWELASNRHIQGSTAG